MPFDLHREHIFYSNDLKLLKQKDMLCALLFSACNGIDSIGGSDFLLFNIANEKKEAAREWGARVTSTHANK